MPSSSSVASDVPAAAAVRDGSVGGRAFTLIELVMVITIIAVLATMAVPAIMSANRKAQYHRALDRIGQTHAMARRLARTTPMPEIAGAVSAYGMVLVAGSGGGRPYCAVTYGTGVAAADELRVDSNGDGSVTAADRHLARYDLPVGLEIQSANDPDGLTRNPMTGRLGWYYRWGGGEPLLLPDPYAVGNGPISIGTPRQAATGGVTVGGGGWGLVMGNEVPALPASPVASFIGLRGIGQLATALAIYSEGTFHAADVP